jgi:hypothetical protein
MTLRTDLTGAWSAAIGPSTFPTPVQVRKGNVFLSWKSSAPSDVRDGFQMGAGDTIVVPAGNAFRLVSVDGAAHEVFYEPYVA